MSNTSIISQIFEFLGELFNSLDKGTLFFGSVWDFIRYAIDIALVTFLFYTLGLNRTTAGRAAVLATVEPAAATLFGVFVMNERIGIASAVGILLVFAAIIVLSIKPKKQDN